MLFCPGTSCSANEFTFDNNICIPLRWKCDYDNDCHDYSDERNCGMVGINILPMTLINFLR